MGILEALGLCVWGFPLSCVPHSKHSELEVARVKRDFMRSCVVGSFLREMSTASLVVLTGHGHLLESQENTWRPAVQCGFL